MNRSLILSGIEAFITLNTTVQKFVASKNFYFIKKKTY